MHTHELVISHSWFSETSIAEREFYVSVELWCPANTRTPNSARKPAAPRKTADKRESLGGQVGALEERRLREKPSWFRGHASGPSIHGQWLSARCKLLDEGDRCVLNIYVGGTFLQDSIYVHLLRCADIRLADRSLFFQTGILGLHVKSGQRLIERDGDEQVYLKFSDTESLNTWTALLRSYAIAEIYGRRLASSHDGGLYRMWRQVFLEVKQVRNLGSPKGSSTSDTGHGSGITSDNESSADTGEMELACEMYVNDVLCGRSTTRKGTGSVEWHEQFTFSDLPPFADLLIYVYREKRVLKPQLLGTVEIILPNFRRGEFVEGWYPIMQIGTSISGTQTGEMRLKMKVDEEIVLPAVSYKPVLASLSGGNMLERLIELEQELKVDHLAEHVIAIAVVNDVLMRDLFALADREVLNASGAQNTLFRGNSVLTKTVELVMNWYGKPFLEASIGSVVRRLCAEKVAIEVDPIRSGKGLKDQEKNTETLVQWCTEFWNSIHSERSSCPLELRMVFHHIRQLVEKRYSDNRNMRWQSVSAFCFLRFIVPAILHPHLFGLCNGMPSSPVQRSLTLVARAIQSLANLNTSGHKEEFSRGSLKEFMRKTLPAMTDYIDAVSTLEQDSTPSTSSWSDDEDSRIQAINSLRERGPTLPTLHREALLFLPHLTDLPKHLAILTSAVVRASNRQHSSGSSRTDSTLAALIKGCKHVEEKASKHVSRLKRPARANVRRLSKSYADASEIQSPSVEPIRQSSPDSKGKSKLGSGSKRNLSLKGGRPSTAPSVPDGSVISRTSTETFVESSSGPVDVEKHSRRSNPSQLSDLRHGDRNGSIENTLPSQNEEMVARMPLRIPFDEPQSSQSSISLSEEGWRTNPIMRFLTKR